MSYPIKWLFAALAVLFLFGLSGCIADTAADSDLPWATNQGWESLGPLPAQMIDPHD
ncbi:MAG: hypothetical protein II649_11330 [Kiritimatiellae bacterium]|nr:hypothetical protein [Kiritimatiellia bacterium]